MSQSNSLGIITGLALVGVLLLMVASLHKVRYVQGPSNDYELAGSSRPVE
jgi:hypothetical protein